MLIFAEKITNRLRYAVAQVLRTDAVEFTSDRSAFHSHEGPKINYSARRFGRELLVVPYGLLSAGNIQPQKIQCSSWNGLTIFFQTSGDLPFDIFSATFYLLSRYEEYLPHKKDSYGRYDHQQSLAYRERFLDKPLVDRWRAVFLKQVEERYPELSLPQEQFAFLPTYDIDIAYATWGRGILRKLVQVLSAKRMTVNGRDVFDVYDWLDQLHRQHHLAPVYFFLVARFRSRYDKNVSVKSGPLQLLVRRIAKQYLIGLHPSWKSFFVESELQEEHRLLQRISQRSITGSRQHYIQFTLPHTFRVLLKQGITDEYSMGYGSINGFRASTSVAFPWYDLMLETVTDLQLHPFCYMEANSFFEQHLSAEDAAAELQHYYDVVRQVNGTCITVFHNHFLTEQEQWLPWRKMYEAFLQRNC